MNDDDIFGPQSNFDIGFLMSILGQLKTDAWRTSGARYNAARRLRRRSFFSTASIAFFSASTVGLALIQSISPDVLGDSELNRYLTVLSGCVGVFLLAISLIEWGARSSEKAENLHRNAEVLNGFQRRLGVILGREPERSIESVLQEQARYEEIKATCFDNHDPIDDALFVSAHRFSAEFRLGENTPRHGAWLAGWIVFRHYWASVWYFLSCWILFVVLVINAPWSVAGACPQGCQLKASSSSQ